MHKSIPVSAAIAAAGLILAACGSSDSAADSPTTTAAAQAATDASFNDADVAFAQEMIPHHSQAVEMATLALDRSENPQILDLASRIQQGQDPEIEQMQGWLATWDMPEMDDEMDGMAMNGMMSDDDMSALTDASGPDFDALFVSLMIQHHDGAITMAKSLIDEGSDPQVRALAEGVIAAQEAEIAEMEALELSN
ncbi:MAG: DUF305 domain-containing protein [Acidimicrobiales bacterium]